MSQRSAKERDLWLRAEAACQKSSQFLLARLCLTLLEAGLRPQGHP